MKLVADIEAKMKKGLCVAWGCTKHRVNRTRFCGKHRRIDFKERYPHQYQYDILRTSAKKRNIAFKLSFKDFVSFCLQTGYMSKKGKRRDDWTIDRINPRKGYQKGNLQILTNRDNVRKQHIDRKIAKYLKDKSKGYEVPLPEEFDWPKPPVYDPDEEIPF